jgi:hypothetical protein
MGNNFVEHQFPGKNIVGIKNQLFAGRDNGKGVGREIE